MILLAIDPGTKQGWAVFAAGVLVACGKGEAPARRVDRLVIERPESRGGHTNTPTDDLISLAILAGIAAGRCATPGCAVSWVKASHWKGQTPKAISHARVLAKLAPEELALVARATGDTLDAVGLGLWALSR